MTHPELDHPKYTCISEQQLLSFTHKHTYFTLLNSFAGTITRTHSQDGKNRFSPLNKPHKSCRKWGSLTHTSYNWGINRVWELHVTETLWHFLYYLSLSIVHINWPTDRNTGRKREKESNRVGWDTGSHGEKEVCRRWDNLKEVERERVPMG